MFTLIREATRLAVVVIAEARAAHLLRRAEWHRRRSENLATRVGAVLSKCRARIEPR